MNYLLLLLLFISGFCFSQETLFVYEVKYKGDSLQKEHKTTSYATLVGKEFVKFFPYEAIHNDSIYQKTGEYQYVSKNMGFEYALKRKLGDDENINYYSKSPLYYSVKTKDKAPVWSIKNETKSIADFKVQKAVGEFGGRSWVAWFASEIPIPEGPYKLRGLPGMILEAYDTKANFLFQLSEIKKIKKEINTDKFLENLNEVKALPITEKQWVKLQMDYYKNPGKDFSGGKIYVKDKDGNTKEVRMDSKEKIEGTQRLLRKYNNPIELNKALRYPEK